MPPPCFGFKHITTECDGLICRNAPPAKTPMLIWALPERVAKSHLRLVSALRKPRRSGRAIGANIALGSELYSHRLVDGSGAAQAWPIISMTVEFAALASAFAGE